MRPVGLAAACFALSLMFVPASFAQDVAAPADGAPTDAGPAVAAAQQVQPAPEEQMICRSEKPIGSKRATRICRSAASREEAREDTLNALRHRRGTPRGAETPTRAGPE